MDDKIHRSAVSDQDKNNIVKYQVEERKDDKLVRHPVIGIGGGSTPAVIEPLSVTENGTYTAPSGVDGYSPIVVNVAGGGGEVYTPTNIKFQKYFREPAIGLHVETGESLIYTDWVYLESAGGTIVPPYPDDGLASKCVVSDVQNATFETIGNATIFYCFSDDQDVRVKGSYPNQLTYSIVHNDNQKPTKIYSYDPTGTFEWTEITPDSTTWNNQGYNNTADKVIFVSNDIIRNTVGTVAYFQLQNLIGESGKISDPYKTDYYDVYYCSQGTQINELDVVTVPAIVEYIGNMTLLGMYELLTGGSFPPNE